MNIITEARFRIFDKHILALDKLVIFCILNKNSYHIQNIGLMIRSDHSLEWFQFMTYDFFFRAVFSHDFGLLVMN